MAQQITDLDKVFAGVTCPQCRERLAACPRNEHGFPVARKSYNVGNIGCEEMGHQMFLTPTGRIALCIATTNDAA